MRRSLLLVLAVVAAVVVLALLYRRRQPAPTSSSSAESGAAAAPTFPLKLGSTGPEVRALQHYLVNRYGAQLPDGATGELDLATRALLEKYLHRDTISAAFYTKANLHSQLPTAPAQAAI